MDRILEAIGEVETGGHPHPDRARSSVGALGRFQVRPSAKYSARDLLNPEINRKAAKEKLLSLANQLPDDISLENRMLQALAGYHAGDTRFRRLWGLAKDNQGNPIPVQPQDKTPLKQAGLYAQRVVEALQGRSPRDMNNILAYPGRGNPSKDLCNQSPKPEVCMAEGGKVSPYKQVFTEELPKWLKSEITDPLLETFAPTTKTLPEAITRSLPLSGEAWTVDDIKQELVNGNVGQAALLGALGLLPLGGLMAAARTSVPKKFKQSGALSINPKPEYQRTQRVLSSDTPNYVELFNKEGLRKTPGKRYAQIYPRSEDDPEAEAVTGVLKLLSGRLNKPQEYALARGSKPSQFSINRLEGEEGINYLTGHFWESQTAAESLADVPANLVSHARGTMLPSGKFLLEEAQSDWWRDVARARQLGLNPVTPQGAQKAWPRELMDELSRYVKSEGGESILVPDSLIKYVTNYGHLEQPPKQHQIARGALKLYSDDLFKGLKPREVKLKNLPLDTQVRQLLGDELMFREVPVK